MVSIFTPIRRARSPIVNAPCISSSMNAGTPIGEIRYLLLVTNAQGRLTAAHLSERNFRLHARSPRTTLQAALAREALPSVSAQERNWSGIRKAGVGTD